MPANVQNLHPAGSTGFGRGVGDARRARHLTQEEAADLLGMSRRKLIDIEADRIELPRYEKTGILAVLDGHYEATLKPRANPTPLEQRNGWTITRQSGDKGWNLSRHGAFAAAFYGRAEDVLAAFRSVADGGDQIGPGFQQRTSVEVILPDGRSPDE